MIHLKFVCIDGAVPPSNQEMGMRKVFFSDLHYVLRTSEDVRRAAPWAAEIVRVAGGWLAIESANDAALWLKQR